MLLRSVIGQQLSVKAAATIYDRVLALFGGRTPTPEQLLEIEPQEPPRRRASRGVRSSTCATSAEHVLSGELELDRLDELSDDEVIAEITAIRGFGLWSAQMFLIFFLERPDVLPTGDLGIRRAAQRRLRARRAAGPGRGRASSASAGARTVPWPRSTSGKASRIDPVVDPGCKLWRGSVAGFASFVLGNPRREGALRWATATAELDAYSVGTPPLAQVRIHTRWRLESTVAARESTRALQRWRPPERLTAPRADGHRAQPRAAARRRWPGSRCSPRSPTGASRCCSPRSPPSRRSPTPPRRGSRPATGSSSAPT